MGHWSLPPLVHPYLSLLSKPTATATIPPEIAVALASALPRAPYPFSQRFSLEKGGEEKGWGLLANLRMYILLECSGGAHQ